MASLELLRAMFVVALLTPVALPSTWIVNRKGGGDFRQIRSAVAAAADGDLILVQGFADQTSYDDFSIDGKGVTIRALDEPFVVESLNHPSMVLSHIGAGNKVAISGMILAGTSTAPAIQITDCAGEVILEKIAVQYWNMAFDGGDPALDVTACANVSLSELAVDPVVVSRDPEPAVRIVDSTVRMTHSQITGQVPTNTYHGGDGRPGGAGVDILRSTCIIARTTIHGGKGAPAGVDPNTGAYGVGGDGGDGIFATEAEIIALGETADIIQGGEGGEGFFVIGYVSRGGDGGTGFHGAAALVSRVQVLGGPGGPGYPDGDPGLDVDGDLSRQDVMPYLDSTGLVDRGDTLVLTLTTVPAGDLVILISNLSGFIPAPLFVGPPLSAIPGRIFMTLPTGHLDAGATRSLGIPIPDDPIMEGFPLHFQGVLLGDDGTVTTSQAVSHIIGR